MATTKKRAAKRRAGKKALDAKIYVAIHKDKSEKDGFAISASPTLKIAKEIKPPKAEDSQKREAEPEEKRITSFASLHGEIARAVAAHRALDQIVSRLDEIKGRLQVEFSFEPTLRKFGIFVFEDDDRTVYELSALHADEVVQANARAEHKDDSVCLA